MNRRRVSELLQAGVAIGPKNLATNSSNPFIQPISEFDNSDTADEGPLPVSTVKAEWMRKRLEESEQEFVMGEDLIIFSGTWNVDGTEVPENFSEWFEFGSRQTPDIVFIGLQEVDRSTQAYIYESSLKEKYWSDAILAKINTTYPGFNFVKVASKLYVGIYAAVFIRDRLIPVVSHVSTSIAACGLMGLVGNKGAVGIRFRVYAEYICFISSHLAAHVPQVERRNQDAAEIGRRLIFNAAQTDYWEELNMLETLIRSFRANPGPASIWESSHLIWAGDLNYRIPLDSSTVRHLSRLGLYDELLQHDQLNLVRCDESSVWAQFEEAPINFAPTFKYDRGTVEFDSSEKERIPAWCDRILFQRDDQLECLDYSAVMQIKSSDHRPVRALFRAKFNRIIPELFTKTYERQLKALDKLENELIPVTLLQCNEIVLETPLVFRRAQTRSVEILNVGQVICQFRFISTGPPGSPICQPWIRIKPIHDILSPGESRQIKLYFLADVTATQKLNQAGGNKIEDILVIHVEGGRDHFVHVTGTFRPTLFCRPLEEICEETVSTHQKTGEMVRTRRVPKPVWIMVDFIIRNGIKTDGLFLVSGADDELAVIQDSLDADEGVLPENLKTEIGILSVGEMLLRFLDCLPQPLIPSGLYEACLEASSDASLASKLISLLPPPSLTLFEYLIAFLGRHYLPRNPGVHPFDVASVFAPCVLKPPASRSADRPRSDIYKAANFLLLFLLNRSH